MWYTFAMSLYIVATPIGNLGDMTYRSIEVLKNVDYILCEDTRTSKKLLDHYDISTPTRSYHAHSSERAHQQVIDDLDQGLSIAIISDAGTPTISDPGVKLVDAVHRECDHIAVVPIPGASALMSALSVSGITSSTFTFLGFLPHKKGRQKIFAYINELTHTAVCYESPHRIMKTLYSLQEVLDESRTIVIARELTKLYEEVIRGNPKEVYEHFDKYPDSVRGEFVIIISA